VRSKKLDLKNLKHFVLDECDKMLAELDMRRDVQVVKPADNYNIKSPHKRRNKSNLKRNWNKDIQKKSLEKLGKIIFIR